MQIRTLRTLDGPNVHLARPVVVATLDLGDLKDRETREFDGFNDALIGLLPGLQEHVCATGAPGGFIERLRTGTYFGHTVEHVALELSSLAGALANFGRTRVTDDPQVYTIVVEAPNAPVMRASLNLAIELVDALVATGSFPALDERLAQGRRLFANTSLGPSTRAIVDAARRRGIPVARLDDSSLVQLGYGARRRLIQSTVASTTSSVAVEIASDKQLTRELLARAFVPVPFGGVARNERDALELMASIGGAVAIKPLDGNQGRGITLNVTTTEQAQRAFHAAIRVSPAVVVEQMCAGRDYRVLVVGGRMVAASERIPAHVVGDGVHTVAQLVDAANLDPRRGEGHDNALTRLRLDAPALNNLAAQQLQPGDVPAVGRHVRLADTANLSTGGTARDVTAEVHAEVASICERAARIVGLDICGVDLITPDISQPLPPAGAGIVEVNAGPGIRMHHHPSEGEVRDAGAAIVDMLFPAGSNGRIPTVAITGTNGKTTTARMISNVFAAAGRTPGLTTTDGVYVGGRPVAQGDMTGPRSARAILGDPAVEVAVLETARGGIVKGGLGYDWSDVGVITNIQLDHVGQDGIRTIEDIVFIKSLVAERVREGGTLVLNADDDETMGLLSRPRVQRLRHQVVLFSLYPRRARIEQHLAAGGTVYFPKNGWIVEARANLLEPLCRISAIPATLEGAARFNISNALAAAAAARALGVDAAAIASALSAFDPARENPGRANLFELGAGYVLMDYGHNPAAFDAVGRMTARWRGRRVTGIIGLPGDRLDSVIRDSAAIAARVFDRIFVREDHDLRGRRPGEVPALIAREIATNRPSCQCAVLAQEREALAAAVETMEPGELIVLFYDEFGPAAEALQSAGAIPMSGGLKALEGRAVHGDRGGARAAADRLQRSSGRARRAPEVPCNRAG